MGTWLIVWEGIENWQEVAADAVAVADPAAPEAHHVAFSEADGRRRALLLVDWSSGERDLVVSDLRRRWTRGFVNEVTDLDVHQLAHAFDGVADLYERTRPDYPAAAIRHLQSRLDIRPGKLVVDIGAGTGKFTRLLIPTGADLIAIEPVEGMRDVFARVLPVIEVRDGTAESIPLSDASVDVVTAAQAAHWFQAGPAFAEMARVLRPGGGAGLIWNVRDESTWPWDEITPILDRYIGDGPRYRSGEFQWKRAAEAAPEFGPVEEVTFSHLQLLVPEDAVGRIAGVSYIAALSEMERSRALNDVRHVLAQRAEDEVGLRYVTQVYTMDRL